MSVDNPLIVHVSSLRMLRTLIPPSSDSSEEQISDLYLALINAFWPGPLTLLFPARNPQNPPPAPQTLGIRLPAHPLARALITVADVPISAPSANSSGRPSPTTAEHVFADLGRRGAVPVVDEDRVVVDPVGMLGCILDAGACDVGVESTVLDGTSWTRKQGRGERVVKVLRPGGIGVEEIESVVAQLDDRLGFQGDQRTRVWVYGRDPPLSHPPPLPSKSSSALNDHIHSPRPQHHKPPPPQPSSAQEINNPSTPGMKYKHYSPSVPVYLIYPTNTFPSAPLPFSTTTAAAGGGARAPMDVQNVVRNIAGGLVASRASTLLHSASSSSSLSETQKPLAPLKFGVMAFTDSPLARAFTGLSSSSSSPCSASSGEKETTSTSSITLGCETVEVIVRVKEFGRTADDAARALFRDMLAFEGTIPTRRNVPDGEEADSEETLRTDVGANTISSSSNSSSSSGEARGVDAIIIEACSEQGVGLAVMERINKAVGGGGTGEGLTSLVGDSEKRFWVRV
ncbi:hypothetical protein QFC22_002587 [Naganishia vaughanmartiniae]|uniref:Uncharacterized protein n=1 Tax=Naganishia vaughanmartiniae TaxID=1424756 RepID=A0ACC2XBJ3_9TREE|nr:hypothetical protein QFC22_002587 [Naganishia vaughanmartiniae]